MCPQNFRDGGLAEYIRNSTNRQAGKLEPEVFALGNVGMVRCCQLTTINTLAMKVVISINAFDGILASVPLQYCTLLTKI